MEVLGGLGVEFLSLERFLFYSLHYSAVFDDKPMFI